MAKRLKIDAEKRKIIFTFEGKKLTAYDGETVAEALIANGIWLFSLSDKHIRPRGYFCGNGTCGQCKMNIDGNENALACKTFVREGMKVKRNIPKIKLNYLKNISFIKNLPYLLYFLKNKIFRYSKLNFNLANEEYSVDILVIGNGDAGNAALENILKNDGNVLMITEDNIDDYADSPKIIKNARIISIDGLTAYAVSRDRILKIRAKKIIIATGSMNFGKIFENNDLPGIMLFSGLKTLLLKKILPGKSVVIYGSSGEEENIADFIESKGIKVNGIVSEIPRKSRYNYFYYYNIDRAYGFSKLKGILIKKGKLLKKLKCDILVFSDKTKNINLLLNMNLKLNYLKDKKSFFPERDKNLLVAKNIYYASGFSEKESKYEGERAALHALGLTKKRYEKIIGLVGGENNESIVQINGCYR